MRNSYLTAGFLSMALAMSLPAVAQSSTTNTPEHRPPEAPSQATPSQAAPGQAGATSEAAPGHAQPQAQAADDNPLNLTDEQKTKLQPILQEVRATFIEKHAAFLIDESLQEFQLGIGELNLGGNRSHRD